jgi:hypothetical protein
MKRLGAKLGDFFPRHLPETPFLICSMGDWYPNRDEVSKLFVTSIFGTWIGHVPVLHVRCTWDTYIERSEEESDTEALLRAIPAVVGEEDREI